MTSASAAATAMSRAVTCRHCSHTVVPFAPVRARLAHVKLTDASSAAAASAGSAAAATAAEAVAVVERRRPLHTPTQAGLTLRRAAAAAAVAATANVSDAGAQENDGVVLVAGAAGGVGQLVVASLLEKGRRVRALVRNIEKAQTLFAGAEPHLLDVVAADLRSLGQEDGSGGASGGGGGGETVEAVVGGVSEVVWCVGTTAFPSKRWDGGNGPEQTDYISFRNLLTVLCSSATLRRIVMVSSLGVTRFNGLPYNILNLFGVLKWKREAEKLLIASASSPGVPYTYTILRPGRLTDGPYTSYDLNTLLKATAGLRRDAVVRRGSDSLAGETSRLLVAEAAAQSLSLPCTENAIFEIVSVEGDGPGKERESWQTLLESAPSSPAP